MVPALLLVGILHATEGPGEWAEMYDARLLEIADGDSRRVSENLESLMARLGPEDPLRGEVAYWLANSRLSLGEIESARSALGVAFQYPRVRDASVAFASQIDAIQRIVTETPIHATFSHGLEPLVHDWQHVSQGAIERTEILEVPGEPFEAVVRWTTRVRDSVEDEVFLTLSRTALPIHSIRVRLHTEGFPAYVRFRATDVSGREYVTEDVFVPTEDWVQTEVPLREFRTSDPGAGRFRPSPWDVRTLHIQNVTAWLSADRGAQVILIDDLEIW